MLIWGTLSMGFQMISVALATLFLVYIMVKLAASPIQLLMKLMVNSIFAVIVLCILSVFGGLWNIHLPINVVTVLLIAILGVPGLILVGMLHFLFI